MVWESFAGAGSAPRTVIESTISKVSKGAWTKKKSCEIYSSRASRSQELDLGKMLGRL